MSRTMRRIYALVLVAATSFAPPLATRALAETCFAADNDGTFDQDGAVNGIDKNSIMGANMTTVKKRHYHAFTDLMKKKSIKNKYGRDYDYLVVDKV